MGSENLTFCFTDIEGSTTILRALGNASYEGLLERHRDLIRAALATTGGHEVKTEGDGFFLAFDDATTAVTFASTAQRALAGERWPTAVRVRMGLHTGPAARRDDGDFVALAVHQAARISAIAHGGQVLLSAATLASAKLPPETGVQRLGAYRLRDFEGPVDLAQLTGDGLLNGFPPLRAAKADHGLRLPRSSLVGRDEELQDLGKLLANHPVVTLVGMGGVGKTRVALEVAAAAAALFPDGLHVAELSPADGPYAVDATLAASIGVRPEPGVETLDAVAATIGAGRRLLILDSCEHHLDRVAVVINHLGSRCPNLVVLSTSTESIRVPDERIMTIGPLALPSGDAADAAVLESDSVRLILQRAVAAGAGLGPTDDELAQIAEISRRLDGIPLALELVAGRIAERGLASVVTALDDRFSLLTNGFRTALPRHRTLEAMVGWSVEQLKPEAAEMLTRLSALQGRWRTADAAVVCSDDPRAPGFIQLLIDRSLVVVDPGPPERIRLLDTVRAYAVRGLGENELADLDRRRTAGLLQRVEELRGGHEEGYLEELDALIPDVRAALTTQHVADLDAAAALGGAVAAWFEQRGLWSEGVSLLTALVERCPRGAGRANVQAGLTQLLAITGHIELAQKMAAEVLAEPAALPQSRALALVAGTPLGEAPRDGADPLLLALEEVGPRTPTGLGARARIALRKQILGDAEGAAADLAAVIADARAAGRPTMAAQSSINLGGVLARLGRLDEAEQHLRTAWEFATSRQNQSLAAGALTNLSFIHLHRGDAAGALRLAEERLEIARQMSQPRGEAAALSAVSTAAIALNDLPRALEAATECRTRCRELRFHEGIATSGFNLVLLSSRCGDHEAAVAHARELLDDVGPTGNLPLEALALLAAGGVLCGAGDVAGIELIVVAESGTMGVVPLDPTDRAWLADLEAALVEKVGADAVVAARRRGASLGLAEARATAKAALAGR